MEENINVKNKIYEQIKDITEPFKMFLNLGNILNFLDEYIEKLNREFMTVGKDKSNMRGLLYDLLEDNIENVGEFIKNKPISKINFKDFQRGIFKTNKFEEFIKKSDFERKTEILKFYSKTETKLENLIIKNSGANIIFQLSDNKKGKNFNDTFNEKTGFFNETFIENIDKKGEKTNEIYFELLTELGCNQKDFIKELKENSNKKEIVKIINEYKKFLVNKKNENELEELKSLFLNLENEVSGKIKIIETLKSLIIIIGNLNYSIFSGVFYSYLLNKIKIRNNIKFYEILKKVSLVLAENEEQKRAIEKFFFQLIDRKSNNFPLMGISFILQNLFFIILILISSLLLPAIITAFILVLTLLNILKGLLNKNILLYRINSGLRVISVIIITLLLFLWGNTFHFDNYKIYNIKFINELFLNNIYDYIWKNDNTEILKCYNFDYLKEGKSCFEKTEKK